MEEHIFIIEEADEIDSPFLTPYPKNETIVHCKKIIRMIENALKKQKEDLHHYMKCPENGKLSEDLIKLPKHEVENLTDKVNTHWVERIFHNLQIYGVHIEDLYQEKTQYNEYATVIKDDYCRLLLQMHIFLKDSEHNQIKDIEKLLSHLSNNARNLITGARIIRDYQIITEYFENLKLCKETFEKFVKLIDKT